MKTYLQHVYIHTTQKCIYLWASTDKKVCKQYPLWIVWMWVVIVREKHDPLES